MAELPRLVQAPDEATAMFAARRQGSRVEVLAQRSETRTVYANPNGTYTGELTAVPTRVKRGAEWVAIDTTLQPRPDGSVAPKAVPGDVALSGGAASPLIRLRAGAAELALHWPGGLPRPVLSGNEAIYHEVLPGVDLVLRAEVRGYSQLLVVKDAAAARNVARIGLPVETKGVRLTAEDSGALSAVDDAGRPVFQSPPSVMWDSSGPNPEASRTAPVGVEVVGNVLNLVPDNDFLADPTTVYPVVIDPTTRPMAPTAWATVLSGKPTQSYWGKSADPANPNLAQVGQCWEDGTCNGIGEAWAYFRFNTQDMVYGKPVLEAKFFSHVAYSPHAACLSHPHQLHWVYQDINPSLTWNNKPESPGQVRSFQAPCGGRGVEVDVTGAVRSDHPGYTTFYLRAANGGDPNAWRKYITAQTWVQVTWNFQPLTPENLFTDPPLPAPCRWCNNLPYVSNDSLQLNATLRDPEGDELFPRWRIQVQGQTLEVREGPGAPFGYKFSGAVHQTTLTLTNWHNKWVTWWIHGDDGKIASPESAKPTFVVDRVAPQVRPGITAALYKEDNRWHGGAGVPGAFTFEPAEPGVVCDPNTNANGICDIDHYLYGWQDPPSTWVDADALGGKATVTTAPPGDGPQALRVVSVDRAGNKSPVKTSHVYVRAGNGPLGQWSFEGKANDSAFLGDRHGTLNGNASYTAGAVGTAVQLDGDINTTVTTPTSFPTESSFTVSAWVRPDRLTGSMAALSQDGANTSAWWLSYDNAANRWSFLVGEKDQRMWGVTNQKAVPAAGEWTHLTGVYDRQTRELRLYVNGSQVEKIPADFAAAPSAGAMVLGRLKWNGMFGGQWAGAVDEVQAFDRPLSDAEVAAMVSRDNVRTGHWKLDDPPEIDDVPNRTARNAVIGGADATLSNGAVLVERGIVGGSVSFDGVDDKVVASRAAVRTDQSFAVSAWVKPDVLPATAMTAVSQDGGLADGNSGFYLQLIKVDAKYRWAFVRFGSETDGSQWIGASVETATQPGVATHLTGMYDAPTRTMSIYVNGVFGASRVLAANEAAWNATGPLVLGQGRVKGVPAINQWDGLIDEVRTYNRTLAPDEVKAMVTTADVATGSWKLDGNTNDSAGPRNGTWVGTPEWTDGQSTDPDPADRAVRLNGSNAISVPNAINTAESFSVAVWVKPDAATGCHCTIVSQDGQRSVAFSISASATGRWVLFAARDHTTTPPAGDYIQSEDVQPGAVQPGVWTHLVGVYSKERKQLEFYVNGVLLSSTPHTITPTSSGDLQIGRTLWDGGHHNYFKGAIDDVKVYNRPLFADEIREMAGRDLSLVHNWKLNETTGTLAADSVGTRGGTLPARGASFGLGRAGWAINLDGTGAVSATGVDLRTDQSFTVSAWVKLTDPGGCVCASTAVSVDGGAGNPASKFRLGHRIDPLTAPGSRGKWVFEMPPGQNGEPNRAAISVNPGEFDRWMLLVGVYDAASKRIELYVYTDDPLDEPDHAFGTFITPWHGTGGLQIGRGTAENGSPGEFWKGSIDDVRLYTGYLDAARLKALYKSYPAVVTP